MRALSDGVSDAYMLDLIVHPDYRKLGAGRTIVHTLADFLKKQGIEWIVCIGVPGSETFYGKTEAKNMDGFTPYRFY
jgi:predicted N-acetyltransferase YhbS